MTLEDLKAGEKWAKNFMKRDNIHSVQPYGEAGSVDQAAIKEGMDDIRALCAKYPARFIFNVNETGLRWKLLPRRTYLSTSEDRKTARGSNSMYLKDRLSAIIQGGAPGKFSWFSVVFFYLATSKEGNEDSDVH